MVINLELTITAERRINVINVNKNVTNIKGVYKNVKIILARVFTIQAFLILENSNKSVILGIPFAIKTALRSKYKKNSEVEIQVTDLILSLLRLFVVRQ